MGYFSRQWAPESNCRWQWGDIVQSAEQRTSRAKNIIMQEWNGMECRKSINGGACVYVVKKNTQYSICMCTVHRDTGDVQLSAPQHALHQQVRGEFQR